MSDYKGWKALERRHAKRIGGKRLWRPDFGESMPDGETDRETFDAKYSVHPVAVVTLFDKCERKYDSFTGLRNFHMVFFSKSKTFLGDLVVCRASRYAELLEKEALLDSHVAAFISTTTKTSEDWDSQESVAARQRAAQHRASLNDPSPL